MVSVARIEHQIPGRLRLRIAEKRGDVAYFQGVVGALSKVSGVEELDGSPLAGSVRIRHSGAADAILAAAVEQGLFKIEMPQEKDKPKDPPKKPQGDAGLLDTIATGLSGLALFQVTQGQFTGTAAENFWNAYGAQRLLGNKVITAGFGLLGAYQLLQGQWLGSASSLLFYALAARQLAHLDRAASTMANLHEPPKAKPERKKRRAEKADKKLSVSS